MNRPQIEINGHRVSGNVGGDKKVSGRSLQVCKVSRDVWNIQVPLTTSELYNFRTLYQTFLTYEHFIQEVEKTMALKEHPFVVTTSIPHDKKTIKYDPTAPNRSTAVGKVYKINADGKAELPADGEEFDGVITAVDDTRITAAYLFGGLRVPLASSETVKRGDKLVAGLGPSSAKGYVKAVSAPADLPADLADIAAGDVGDAASIATAENAGRTQINSVSATVAALVAALNGKGSVLEFDTTHALITMAG